MGRSTYRVHPYRQETARNRLCALSLLYPRPVPSHSPQATVLCTTRTIRKLRTWTYHPSPGGHTHTHTQPAPWHLCWRSVSRAPHSEFHTISYARKSAHPFGAQKVYLTPSQCPHRLSHTWRLAMATHFRLGRAYDAV